MPDCSQCNRALGRHRLRCKGCGACQECCTCDVSVFRPFDADELGLDPEQDDDFLRGGDLNVGRLPPSED